MDCGAMTDCEVCIQQVADAGGVQGDELYAHLRSLPRNAAFEHAQEG
jgi:hypothetical protein